jgi:DNA-binding NtrC family response regulator
MSRPTRAADAVPAPSVLVAEDEAPIAAVLLDLLADEGFAVRHARDGEQALAEIERDPPDVLVSNVRMPRVDGIELARRARERAVPIPVVLIGANGDGADVPGAIVVAKPVDRDRLLEVVRRTYRDRTPNQRVTA